MIGLILATALTIGGTPIGIGETGGTTLTTGSNVAYGSGVYCPPGTYLEIEDNGPSKGVSCIDEKPTIVLTEPPCGTPEARKDENCQQWVLRKPPVQPADVWPSYEHRSHNLILLPKPVAIGNAFIGY